MPWPNPAEVCEVTVNGMRYLDWETVMVKHSLIQVPPYIARFTVSEVLSQGKLPSTMRVMQIKPGDPISVTLGGQSAFNGKVETRQVFYDSRRHYVEIQAAVIMEMTTASVISQTMEWTKSTPEKICRDCLGKIGINFTVEGGSLPSFTIPRYSATHGQSVFDFVETLLRHTSQQSGTPINITSNLSQDFVATVGPQGGAATFIEGVNILEGREIIYNPGMRGGGPSTRNPAMSQQTGDDQDWGAKVASIPFIGGTGGVGGLFGSGNPMTILSEIPTKAKEVLQGRASSEAGWNSDDQITVTVTVQGWMESGGGLWRRNGIYSVSSPMLIMQNQSLKTKSVTFTQDNRSGTRTILELCNNNALGKAGPATRAAP